MAIVLQSPGEEHSFGESAFAAPAASTAVPDLMDFGFDSAPPPAPASSSAQQPPQPSVHADTAQQAGLGGFADLMAASAQPNLIDADPFAASRPHSSEVEAHPPQQAVLDQPGYQPAQPIQLGLDHAPPRSLHGAFDAASAAANATREANPFGAPPAFPTFPPSGRGPKHELSFNGEPAPEWDPPAAAAAAQLYPDASTAAAPPAASAAASSLALVPAAGQPSAAAPAAAGPSAKQVAKLVSRSGSARAADPTGFVLEDLLAHAVENLRIKNAAKTTLAGRLPTQAPSLMVRRARSVV